MHPRPGSSAPHPHPRRVPLLDLAVLEGLEAEVPGPGRRFASAFVAMWDRRYARIAAALDAGHADEAIEAVLSLKASAAMVGARRLAAAAACLESALRSGEPHARPGSTRVCGQRTIAAIQRRCLPPPPEPG